MSPVFVLLEFCAHAPADSSPATANTLRPIFKLLSFTISSFEMTGTSLH
jgi:hypothetical protein